MALNNKQKLIIAAVGLLLVLSLSLALGKIFSTGTKEQGRAKIAIVIDDWGYNLHHLDLLRQIKVPITVSILPNLRYSDKIAHVAQSLNQETILHLPLEPEIKDKYIGLEKNTITSNMTQEEVVQTLAAALDSIPFVRGVSNHMGSRATQNMLLMSVVFGELKSKQLFFLDNLVTDESICKDLAQKMELDFVARDVFLDNLDDYEYIKGQFKQLTEIALKHGRAVGIGHDRFKTLQVLLDLIPALQKQGIKFVFVSDLLE